MTDLEKQAEDAERMLSFGAGVEELVKLAVHDPAELLKTAGVKDMKELSGWILDYTASMASAERGEETPASATPQQG